jgi:glutaredoxin
MLFPTHVCPSGLKALHLLRSRGYRVDDRPLPSRAATDQFKQEHGVATTPQVFIGGRRIGGYDDLRRYLGLSVPDGKAPTYQPVIAVFAVALVMALAAASVLTGRMVSVRALEWFVAFSMCLLALLKLQDIERFATTFLTYDLLAQRWVPYARIYPFAELAAGGLMIAGVATWLSVPIALVIGSIGAVSVVKAVYIDRREISCACAGGGTRVPLGPVSLAENLIMVAMAVWMLVTHGL